MHRSTDGKRVLCIDILNKLSILSYLKQSPETKEKFQKIVSIILGGYLNDDLYEKQTIQGQYIHVSAMNFYTSTGFQRLFCKEQTTPDGLFIIAAHLETDIQNPIIHKIANYDYEIESHRMP